ncbi:unnamed protein product [Chironomus riparius]|uniref:Uncharacterized protein n=1 Tax=Chironomus riparius TaxID=315576 RepID=A0A9N9WZB9_9DIPT|nr:unnamed protein product [Chironomus riparius]
MKFSGINYCESMSNLDANPIFKEVVKILYRTNPDLVIDCPTTKIELSFLFKYTNIYREVLKFPRINYCESTKHIDAYPLFKEFTKIMYNTNPNLFIDCPTTKVIFNNTIVKIDTLPSIFPRGDYKVILHITDSKSMKEFLIIQAMVTIVSSELETFG